MSGRDERDESEAPMDRPEESPELRGMLEPLRDYHEPGETPREEMWQAIVARIRDGAAEPRAHPIERARRRRVRPGPWLGWAAAASVVLLIGVAVGRSTAPEAPAPSEGPVAVVPSTDVQSAAGLDMAVRGHLGRTESLLTAVRSDGRQGRVDPAAAAWARGLLTQTRLLLDARAGGDPALIGLLQDLELVLAEILVVAEAGSMEGPRAQAELDLVLQALELSSLLPRLQAACPQGCMMPAV